jgi:hypothetical protein
LLYGLEAGGTGRGQNALGGATSRAHVEGRGADALVAYEVGEARKVPGLGELREAAVAEVVGGEGGRLVGRQFFFRRLLQLLSVVVLTEDQARLGKDGIQRGARLRAQRDLAPETRLVNLVRDRQKPMRRA